PPERSVQPRDLRLAWRHAARLAGPRDDIRALPFRRAARGDGAEATIVAAMTTVAGLTGATLLTAPTVCHECIWWQSRGHRSVDKRKWIEKTESEWGAWGTVYYDDDQRVLGSMQYG